ncbi:MAG: LPS export ABC transporter permease LptG [Pseudomonadota bacterium]|nr:LPS export ABC transporter permease LptG [Pseudomonadota bacterium]
MHLFPTLSAYIARHFLASFLAFLGIVAGLIWILDTIELLRRAADKPGATLGIVLKMGLYKLPETGQIVLPFIVLFAAMFALWRLTRSHELVVARASGVSAWQFLLPMLAVALLMGLVTTTVINPAAATLVSRYEHMENRYLKGRVSSLNVSKYGLWLRQPYADGHALIHAENMDLHALTLNHVMVLFFRGEDTYAGRLDAPAATLQDGLWKLQDVLVNIPGRTPEHRQAYSLPTVFTLDRIQESFAPPATLSFWELPRFIGIIENTGLSSLRHRMHFHSLLAQPLLFCAMVLLAAIFTPHSTRRGGVLSMIIGGIVAGFALYMIRNIASAFGSAGSVPPFMAAWSPTVASLLLGTAALLQKEDG